MNPSPKSKVGKRERRQQQRIGEGVQSGQLTPAETARIEARAAELHRQIAQDRADGGKLTVAERRKIQAELDELSAKIAKQKHDEQSRPPSK